MKGEKTMKKRLVCFLVLLIILATLSGCIKKELTGFIALTVKIPQQLQDKLSRDVLDGITISKVTITVRSGSKLITAETQVVNGEAKTTISGVFPGMCQVEAWAIEVSGTKEYIIFESKAQTIVQQGKTTTLMMEFALVPGDIAVTVQIPEVLEYTSGQVTVFSNIPDQPSQVKTFTSATEPISFTDLPCREYPIYVELLDADNQVIFSQETSVEVKPGRSVDVLVVFNNSGSLDVYAKSWQLPPKPPTNLSAQVDGNFRVILNWEPSLASGCRYEIARSKNISGPINVIPGGVTSDLSFSDAPTEGDGAYYYWVAALDQAGVNSEWTGPVEVEIERPLFGLRLGATWDINISVHYIFGNGEEDTFEQPVLTYTVVEEVVDGSETVYTIKIAISGEEDDYYQIIKTGLQYEAKIYGSRWYVLTNPVGIGRRIDLFTNPGFVYIDGLPKIIAMDESEWIAYSNDEIVTSTDTYVHTKQLTINPATGEALMEAVYTQYDSEGVLGFLEEVTTKVTPKSL